MSVEIKAPPSPLELPVLGAPRFGAGSLARPDASARAPRGANQPLPATREEMAARGWEWVDVVFGTGDAYID
ncbi:MAG: hypothetical protein K1X71_19440, partial [Pirellulales bacterium]|nr:hypothetical protein [Pirellulales bacterium]